MMSLADAILQEDLASVRHLLHVSGGPNQLDEYGFTPLIEAAIIDNQPISAFLLKEGADPNQQDLTGNTALHWAAENNNVALCRLLLQFGADPNAYNFAGQPVLTMPMLRRQSSLKKRLVRAGADELFAQDYINTKLLGHVFELVGTATIVSPKHAYVEVDFEGFFLEITIGLIADSLRQFRNHFAARQLRRFFGLIHYIEQTLNRASELIAYQQYRVNIKQHSKRIHDLLRQQPVIIPVGYEGHAITFIHYGSIWAKCDRREDSRLYDNVMLYDITHPKALTVDLMKHLIYTKQSSEFINRELDDILGLVPITELQVEAQISGNCSWANVEATIPTLFFIVLMMQSKRDEQAIAYYKTLALNVFHRWREWNKDRLIHFCIQSYQAGDAIRKACKAEILAAILYQYSSLYPTDTKRSEAILAVLLKSPYAYLLKNYLRVYYYDGHTDEGRRFAELLKKFGY